MYNEKLREILVKNNIEEIYAYSRKSRSIKDEDSLEKHRDELLKIAEELSVKIKIFEEIDSSETLNRIEFSRMRHELSDGRGKALIIVRLDRISRKTSDIERVIKEFLHNGVTIYELYTGNEITEDNKGNWKLQAVLSDIYLDQVSSLLFEGRKRAVRVNGSNMSVAPLGYSINRVEKKLYPNEKAHIIEYIFKLYLSGVSTHAIATRLNQEGYKNRLGKKFLAKAIWSTLQNEKYIGWQVTNKEKWYKDEFKKKKSKKREKEDWIVYKEAHEAIIKEEDFYKVQEMLKNSRDIPVHARKRTYSLSSMIVCANCGRKMTFVKGGKLRACGNRDYTTGKMCGNYGNGILVPDIERELLEHFLTIVKPFFNELNIKEAKEGKGRKLLKNNEVKLLRRNLTRLDRNIENLIDLQVQTGFDPRYTERMSNLKKQHEIVKCKLESAEAEYQMQKDEWSERFLCLMEEIDKFPTIMLSGTNEEKNFEIMKYYKCVIHKSGEKMKFVFREEIEMLINTTKEK